VCQLCGKTKEQNKEKLSIHHIDYNKDNCDPKNLISLCGSCHVKTNFTRDYWEELLQYCSEKVTKIMIDRIRKLKNISHFPINVEHSDGLITSVPPLGILENVKITNLDEVRSEAVVTMDLAEVKEPSRKTRING